MQLILDETGSFADTLSFSSKPQEILKCLESNLKYSNTLIFVLNSLTLVVFCIFPIQLFYRFFIDFKSCILIVFIPLPLPIHPLLL